MRRRLGGWCLWLALLLAWPIAGWAGTLELRNPSLIAVDDGYAVTAEVTLDLGRSLEDAVMRGITLSFRVDFELLRPRWYWLDEKVVSRSQSWQLSYHALTRRYRLSSGALHQNFGDLNDALNVISRLRRWTVIERERLSPGVAYRGALRFQLDTTQLPKPFQLTALGNRDWELGSDWVTWDVRIEPPPPAAVAAPAPATSGDPAAASGAGK